MTRVDELWTSPAPQDETVAEAARRLVVVIPAYNEAANLSRQLPLLETELRKTGYPWQIVVVDDGSSDDTAAVIASLHDRLPVVVIRHEHNRGCGQAFRSGLTEALQGLRDDDIVMTIEADNTQNLRAIHAMLEKLDEGFEVVVGSYFAPGGMLVGAPFVRYACSRASNWLYHLCFPIRGVSCYTGFFRAYRGAVLHQARRRFGERWLEGEGFTVMAGFLLKLRRMPVFIAEVPLIVRFDQRMGSSKMKLLPTILEHLRVMAREMGRRNLV